MSRLSRAQQWRMISVGVGLTLTGGISTATGTMLAIGAWGDGAWIRFAGGVTMILCFGVAMLGLLFVGAGRAAGKPPRKVSARPARRAHDAHQCDASCSS